MKTTGNYIITLGPVDYTRTIRVKSARDLEHAKEIAIAHAHDDMVPLEVISDGPEYYASFDARRHFAPADDIEAPTQEAASAGE